jgi:hypothetical protein
MGKLWVGSRAALLVSAAVVMGCSGDSGDKLGLGADAGEQPGEDAATTGSGGAATPGGGDNGGYGGSTGGSDVDAGSGGDDHGGRGGTGGDADVDAGSAAGGAPGSTGSGGSDSGGTVGSGGAPGGTGSGGSDSGGTIGSGGVPGGGSGGADPGGTVGSGGAPGGIGSGGSPGGTGSGGAPGTGGGPDPHQCADVFSQDLLVVYDVTLAPAVWEALLYDFHHREEREAAGQDINPYHPVQSFRYGDQVITSAMIRLKGNSSWRHALEAGDNPPKLQFVISFNEVNNKGRFHGLRKIELDMPRNDQSFLRQRMAASYLRALGVPAPCANSAKLYINGAYYGLYTHLERQDKEFLQRLFPGQEEGDYWDAGGTLITNEENMSLPHPRYDALEDLTTVEELAALADMDETLLAWAGEAMIADVDGYWSGRHNFTLYDHPSRGFLWVPHDLDSAIDWADPRTDPIFWWTLRVINSEPHIPYVVVINDATWRERYVAKIQLAWQVATDADLPGRLDRFAAQIRDAALEDPTKPFTGEDHFDHVESLRAALVERQAFVRSWLECRMASPGTATADADGDGFGWCFDCNDTEAGLRPGAAEICGDAVDQNCSGLRSEGCP